MLEGISKIARSGHLTIPAKIRNYLHIKEGDIVRIMVTDHKIVIMPGTLIDNDQAYLFRKECRDEIRESEEDFSKGKYSSYRSAEALKKEIEND